MGTTVPTPTPAPHARPGVMSLLARGVPLTLLLDLALGPHSRDLLDQERLPRPRDPDGCPDAA